MSNNINIPDSREATRDWGGENLSTCNKQANGKTHSSEYCAMNNCDMSLTNNLISGLKMDFLEITSEFFAEKTAEEIIKNTEELIFIQLVCQPSKDETKSDTEEPTIEVLEEGYPLSHPVLSVIDTRQNRRKQARVNEKALKSNTANVGTFACMLVTLNWVYEYITSNEDAEVSTEGLRKLRNNLLACLPSKDSPEYPSKYDEAKKQCNDYKCDHFKGVPFSFIGGYRKTEYLIRHTGLFMIDTDDLETDYPNLESQEERLREVRELMKNDPLLKTVLIFVSPTARGLKWCVWHDIYAELRKHGVDNPTVNDINKMHTRIYMAICNYLKVSYGLTADTNCKDLPHLHLLPHDPDCYYNPNFLEQQTQAFDVDYWHDLGKEEKQTIKYAAQQPNEWNHQIDELEYSRLCVQKALQWARQAGCDPTWEYDDWYTMVWALLDAFPEEEAKQYFHELSSLSSKYDEAFAEHKFETNKSKGRGEVTIKSFFGKLRDKSGIDLSNLCKEVWKENRDRLCAKCASIPQNYILQNNSNISCNSLYYNDIYANNTENITTQYTEGLAQNAQKGISTFSATFSDNITLEDWVEWFRPIVECENGAGHRDKIILPSLVQIGAIISSNVYGVYKRQPVYPNLLLLQYCPPAIAKKGAVKDTYLLTERIDDELHEEYLALHKKWDKDNDDWIQMGKTKKDRELRGLRPAEPLEKRFDIAPKTTSAALYQQLHTNNGLGIIRATEGQVLQEALKNTYGDWVEILLYAFQNEPAKKDVLKDHTSLRIKNVKLAMALTCPPETAEELFKKYISTGLISRLLIQQLPADNIKPEDVFADDDVMLSEIFRKIGDTVVYDLYKEMQRLGDRQIQFLLTLEMKEDFNKTLSEVFYENTELYGISIAEFMFRIFLMFFKLAMTLSVMRAYQEAPDKKFIFDDNTQSLLCKWEDYKIAKTIILQMTRHTLHVFSRMHTLTSTSILMEQYKLNADQTRLIEDMPEYFSTKDVRQWCMSNKKNYESVRRWLGEYVDYNITRKGDKSGTYYKNV